MTSPGGLSPAESSVAFLADYGLEPVAYSKPHPLSHDEWQARGLAAYDLGEMIEEEEGLTPDAVAAYHEASVSLNAAVWEASSEQLENPLRTWVIASSLAKQARAEEVAPYREPQYDEDGKLIDRRENLERISTELLIHAGAMTWSQDEDVKLVLDDDTEAVWPSEVVTHAAEEAGGDTGEDTASYLEAVVEEATHEHDVVELGHDATDDNVVVLRPELVAKTADIAISALRGAHEVPIAAAA